MTNRLTIVESEDYTLDLEYSDEFFILHLLYFKPSVASVRELKNKVIELKQFSKVIGYSGVYTGVDPLDTKTPKLLRMLNAEKIGNSEGIDVYQLKEED